jgi:ParB-like chromosome segregation protein Spo0J
MKSIIIESVNINELKEFQENPRKITKKALSSLKKSLKEFKDFQILVIDENNRVISGNQRFLAMKEIGIEKVDCKRLIGYTESELKTISIRANNHSGEFDYDLLSELMKDVEDLELTGFSEIELDKLNVEYNTDFQPVDAGVQPHLDEKAKVKCPECGHEFTP